MSTSRVYAGRLAGLVVLGPDGESVGRVRDVVITIHGDNATALGLVVEIANKRKIFLPMLRIAAITATDITTSSSSVNLRPFKSRSAELTIFEDLVGSKVHTDDPEHEELHGKVVEITDVELSRSRRREWKIRNLAVTQRSRLGRKTSINIIPIEHIQGLHASGTGVVNQDAELIASFKQMRNADVANALVDMDDARRNKIAAELDDERLADVLAEMPDDDQTAILEHLNIERAADVLLELMDPEESEPVRRLMNFSPETVGALMTPEPIILTPQATVAEALAHARNPELPTSLSSMIFVVRPPQATPTGKYLGCVHLQKLLREPPSSLVSGILDLELPALFADDNQETAARYFATYNLVCGPVLDHDQHLLGAVSVDDLLDHMLPEDWREEDWRVESPAISATPSTPVSQAASELKEA